MSWLFEPASEGDPTPLVEGTPLVERTRLVEPVETKPFTILVVCTGNICRSPVAEQLLTAKLSAAGIPALVHSAGTRALVGSDMTAESAVVSQRFGGDPAGHAAQQLTAELVDGADLIVTATREHRGETVALLPRASRRTFTLTQLARLVAALDEPADPSLEPANPLVVPSAPLVEAVDTRLRAYIVELAASRGATPPPPHPEDDDITDPYRRSQEVYDEVGAVIDTAVRAVSRGFVRAIGKV